MSIRCWFGFHKRRLLKVFEKRGEDTVYAVQCDRCGEAWLTINGVSPKAPPIPGSERDMAPDNPRNVCFAWMEEHLGNPVARTIWWRR